MNILAPRSGTAFYLKKKQKLKVIDIEGEQVSDFFCYEENDLESYLSNGRTFDYLNKIYISLGDILYSSKSRAMAKVTADTVETHDFLLTPCSRETFSFLYEDAPPLPGCEGNLLQSFKRLCPKINFSCLPTTLNLFMNVPIDTEGKIDVLTPKSQAGDYVVIEALEDLIVGLTACTAPKSNNGLCKPIGYEIFKE